MFLVSEVRPVIKLNWVKRLWEQGRASLLSLYFLIIRIRVRYPRYNILFLLATLLIVYGGSASFLYFSLNGSWNIGSVQSICFSEMYLYQEL